MSNGNYDDRENTIKALENPRQANGWLHKEGTQANRLDQLLLRGATIKDMAENLIRSGLGDRDKLTTIGRIHTHLSHLQRQHKLPLKTEINIWQFDL
ncbi:MAG: hypothetical protein ACLPYB_16485 [Desulfobaccales bacterium]